MNSQPNFLEELQPDEILDDPANDYVVRIYYPDWANWSNTVNDIVTDWTGYTMFQFATYPTPTTRREWPTDVWEAAREILRRDKWGSRKLLQLEANEY